MRVRILNNSKMNILSSFVNLFPDIFKYIKENEVFEAEIENNINYLKFPSKLIEGIGINNRSVVLGPEEIIILECKMKEDYIERLKADFLICESPDQ